ncbi:bZIP transcription factor 23 isoform X2 [Ziziphus jujuba]|uniref:BZIP transcription factor 23 isoform X2 n=2 Tax=Ziziphus jujuba TaxID=326968 RepID=A0AC41YZK2_ZIZJJ|nr:bZIP transcription factor 23 isoform X2 [Ziziphus jujuba]
MGTNNINFKSFVNDPPTDGGGAGRPPGNDQLMRQPSIYSLTFDELQNTMGGLGKDFGSMNMDELLKNIWSAEETQTMVSAAATTGGQDRGIGGTQPLQRQGSLTLPRTLSQKTVDEVWKDIFKDGSGAAGANMPQRQHTLGEMTLEEFLVRAGVVREDAQLAGKPPTDEGSIFFGDLPRVNNNTTGLGINFQQTGRPGAGLMNNRISENNNNNNNQIAVQATNLPLNVNGVRSNQQQNQQKHHQQQIFPKQPTAAYPSQMPMANSAQLGSPAMRNGIMGISDQGLNTGLVQGSALPGGGIGVVGLGAGPVSMAAVSPANQLSSDGVKSNGDTSSVSPVPYVFNGGLRGRKCSGAVEKVVERRQRRMIKNRESAARSRARKQAYTMELEAEVAKLKEENQELKKKQAEMLEMQKNQAMEMMNVQRGVKKRCLRRTQTGPW